jgi:hypothetical protein
MRKLFTSLAAAVAAGLVMAATPAAAGDLEVVIDDHPYERRVDPYERRVDPYYRTVDRGERHPGYEGRRHRDHHGEEYGERRRPRLDEGERRHHPHHGWHPGPRHPRFAYGPGPDCEVRIRRYHDGYALVTERRRICR